MIEPTLGAGARSADGRRPIVVLLVDDQPFIGSALRMILQSQPDIELHQCLLAVNAIALANQICPTVVLQDLIMSDGDGLSLIASFRTNPLTVGTPVIALSGNDDASSQARAAAVGAKGYLVKLPPPAELIACIRHHAARSAGGTDTLDLAVIEGFREAGAPAFTRRLIDQFIHEATLRVEQLKEAAAQVDAPALNAAAHGLNSRSMIVGATRLGVLSAQVEEEASRPGGGVTPALITEIAEELGRVRNALTVEKETIGQR
jgi:PleD family two-component response regulator